MRFALAAAVLFAAVCESTAFVSPYLSPERGSTLLKLSEEEPPKLTEEEPPEKLTSSDILNRARKAVGMPEVEEAPKLFDDDLLKDMQQSLLALEKRVKEGPGSLLPAEVEDFQAATKRIVEEMNGKLSEQSGDAQGASKSSAVAPAVDPPAPSASKSPPVAARKPASSSTASSPTDDKNVGYGKTDMSNDEAPAYDGTGGMGVARGTRNTYVIPGMEEMSPEEYRKALQQTVTGRQTRRKGKFGGVVGNRAAHQYMDQLGAGGASGNWREGGSSSSSPPPRNRVNYAPTPSNVAAPRPVFVTHEHNPVPASFEQVEINEAHRFVDKVVNPQAAKDTGYGKTDMSNDETPAYDGTGGMGVARETRNTYVIPGMEEMSPEEYRAALQKSVSDRQTRRKGKFGGMVGNRATHQYMDHLGFGGASGNKKHDEEQ